METGTRLLNTSHTLLTPESLWSMERINSIAVSADGEKIAYSVVDYSIKQNTSHHTIYVMNSDGSEKKLLTRSKHNEREPAWIDNDTRIAFISNRSGRDQVWAMSPKGKYRKQLSNCKKPVEGFLFSPNGEQVIIISTVTNPLLPTKPKDLPESTGMIATDLMYRHWDRWKTELPHPFLASYNGNKIAKEMIDILHKEPFECPMRPFGDIGQLAWSPGSDQIAFVCKKKQGLEYSKSTDSDIYTYRLSDGLVTNLCKIENSPSYGYDLDPLYSPDGSKLAWISMERDGYESDLRRLLVFDIQTGKKEYVTKSFNNNIESFVWDHKSENIYFIGNSGGVLSIYSTDLDGHINQIESGCYNYTSIKMARGTLITKRESMSEPADIFSINPANVVVTRLTEQNDQIMSRINTGQVQKRWIETTDGKQMLTWIIYPPGFNPDNKYPALLYCQGGPQSTVSQFWSYRWNFQLMAAKGYIVIAPNRRGVPGFGPEWNEQISGDYGGQCMLDLFSAIDTLSLEPYIDKDRIGCVGASFGAYTVYWMAGHHQKRFKAFIAHDGIFNMEQQYLETEEMWFADWDFKGPYWEHGPLTEPTYSNSPHLFVDKWDTPILCIHGEKDYRVLYSQGLTAFNAAILRGVPARLLLFSDENHWILKPQNAIQWQREFFGWLDKWLK